MRYKEKPENVRLRQARWRERTRRKISLRVCIFCKYPFISGKGLNTCYDCMGERLTEFCRVHKAPNARNNRIRWDQRRSGMVRATWHPSTNPAIPIPEQVENDWHFKEAVKKTFDICQPPLARRIIGWPPFPHLKFEGFDVGRPQEKIRRLR